MRAYLEVEDLWDTIEAPPDGQLSTDAKKLQKARGRLVLAVEPDVHAYISSSQTPKDIWSELAKTFDDKGLNSKVNLLMEVSTTKLENCKSMEEYVSRIISASKKLTAIGTVLNPDLVGALLLTGLPASYRPMIMALSNSGKDITADYVKSKLLEEPENAHSATNFEARGFHAQAPSRAPQFQRRGRSYRGRHPPGHSSRQTYSTATVRCYNCNQFGHYANKCPAPNKRQHNACTATAEGESEDEDPVCALFTSCSGRETHTVIVQPDSVYAESQTSRVDAAILAVDLNSKASKGEWVLDSGASMHMCCSSHHMINMRKPKITEVTAANKAKLSVQAEGDIMLSQHDLGENHKVLLQDVLHLPNITTNLFSVSAVTKKGFRVIFAGPKCFVQNSKGTTVLEGKLSGNNVYKLNLQPWIARADKPSTVFSLKATASENIGLWHRRLAHINAAYLRQLCHVATGIQFNDDKLSKCEVCVAGKLTNKTFQVNNKRAPSKLALVHSDVCQVEDLSIGKAKYFVTFLDDHTRKIFVYFLKHKDEVPNVVEKFIKMAENQTGHKLKTLRTDNGREYVNSTLKGKLDNLGVRHETSIPYHPQQNGRAERVNRTLLEKTRCMLAESMLPKKFWAEAVSTACYLSNRSPKRSLGGKTPEELWTGQKPNLSHLRVFGCKARAYVPNNLRTKLEPTSKPAILVGYCENQKGYRLWSHQEQKVFTASNAEFFEQDSHATLSPKHVFLPLESSQPGNMDQDLPEDLPQEVNAPTNMDQDLPEDVNISLEPEKKSATNPAHPADGGSSEDETFASPVRKSQRRKAKPRHLDDFVVYSAVAQSGEPQTFDQAISGPEAAQWQQAMQSEYASILKNKTWELCVLPSGQSVVGSRWIYKKKTLPDGGTRYKARLVAQGFSQIKGINYEETYSPVVRFTSLRLLFAYAARKSLDVYHLDVETAFLHGDMHETVYLQQPQGYVPKGQENKVCLLKKAIYGLKQGSRNWNLKLDRTLKEMNLLQSQYDSCVYSFYSTHKCIVVGLFVDDLIVFTNSIDYLKILKEGLSKMCDVKYLGPIQKCLGINVRCDKESGTIQLDQTDYITSLLNNFGMAGCRSCNTPMDPNSDPSSTLSPQTAFNPANIPYQNAVGSLLYLVQATRPDLAFAVSTISRFNQCFNESHWNMIKRIFRYVQGTKNLALTYTKNADTNITGYCDASWATDPADPRSTTGYVFSVQGGAICWNSRKQSTVALSSTEAEYLSLSSATQEALWLNRLAQELLIVPSNTPLLIHSDNKGAIDLSKNSRFSGRTKHINVRHHFIKGSIEKNEIDVQFTPSTHMLADALTKATTNMKLQEFIGGVGLKEKEERR